MKIPASIVLLVSLFLPALSAADQVSVQMAQILPTGQNTCGNLPVASFTPYIYENALNSFDVVVPDTSYVTVAGSVSGANIPLNYMTRSVNAQGMLRMHVDVYATSVQYDTPIVLTMLSSKGPGAPTCAAVVSIVITGTGTKYIQSQQTQPVSEYKNLNGSSFDKSLTDTTPGHKKGTASTSVMSATKDELTTSTFVTRIGDGLDKACSIDGGASRLWTVLLAAYVLIIAAAILISPSTSNARSDAMLAIAILVPLIAFFVIWRSVDTCTTAGSWVPLTAILCALVGTLLGYRNHLQLSRMFSLPEA